MGEEPHPGNKESGTSQGQRGARGTEHRLLAGTKPLTSQAPASAPRSDWNTDPPGGSDLQKASTMVHGWLRRGGDPESYRGPALPARPAGFSASTRPPCLQASPTGAGHPEVLLPLLQNLGGAPDPTDRLGPGPGLGVDDDEERTRGIEVCWPTASPDVPDPLYDAGRVLPALPSPLLADPHPTPPSDLRPCSLGLGLDRSSKMASLAHELWRPRSRPSKTRATLTAAPLPTPVPSQENGNISGRGYELLGTRLCCVCGALWNPGGLGGRAPAGTPAHCCLFPRWMDHAALRSPPHPPGSLVLGGKPPAREGTAQPVQGPRGRNRSPSHQAD